MSCSDPFCRPVETPRGAGVASPRDVSVGPDQQRTGHGHPAENWQAPRADGAGRADPCDGVGDLDVETGTEVDQEWSRGMQQLVEPVPRGPNHDVAVGYPSTYNCVLGT
jgi:hypothetical protein